MGKTMYLLSKEGNRHLLEFLRNLTPQVLLLSTALLLFIFWEKRPQAYWYLMLAVGVSVMCLVGVVANVNNLMDNAFSHAAAIAAERDRLETESINGLSRIVWIIRFIWKEKPSTVVELLVVIVFVYSAMITILIASLMAANRALQ